MTRVRGISNTVARALRIPVVAGGLVAALARLPYLHDMFLLDVSVNLTVSRGWLDGALPYRDVFDHKGPLTYALLAGVEWIIPPSPIGIRIFLFGLLLLSIWQLAALVGRHPGPNVAWAAAVLYGLAGSSAIWEINEPNSEQLALPFLVAVVDLADRYALSGKLRHAAGAGAVLAALAWMKPQLAFIAPVVLVLLWLGPRRIPGLLSAAAAGLAVTVAVVLPWITADAFDEFRYGVFGYNRHYADIGTDNLFSRDPDDFVAWLFWTPGLAFVVAAVALGVVAWMLDRHRRLVAIFGGWLALEFAGGKLGVREFPHYFVPIIPACCVLIVAGVDAVAQHVTGLDASRRRALALALWLPAAFFLVLSPVRDRIARTADPRYEQSFQVADAIKRVTDPGDEIYVVAYDLGQHFYWLSDRNPASRWIFPAITGGPPYEFEPRFDKALADLQADPPAAMVLVPGVDATWVQPVIDSEQLRETADIGGIKILAAPDAG